MASILLVEPDKNLRLLVTEELTELGHDVRAVATADAALAQVRESIPDLVILEVILPRTEGLRLLVRLLGGHSDLPIIVHTTARDYLGTVMWSLVDAYVLKSSDLRPLAKAVERILRRMDLLLTPWRTRDLSEAPAAIL